MGAHPLLPALESSNVQNHNMLLASPRDMALFGVDGVRGDITGVRMHTREC